MFPDFWSQPDFDYSFNPDFLSKYTTEHGIELRERVQVGYEEPCTSILLVTDLITPLLRKIVPQAASGNRKLSFGNDYL
jgi:hypothetical protein